MIDWTLPRCLDIFDDVWTALWGYKATPPSLRPSHYDLSSRFLAHRWSAPDNLGAPPPFIYISPPSRDSRQIKLRKSICDHSLLLDSHLPLLYTGSVNAPFGTLTGFSTLVFICCLPGWVAPWQRDCLPLHGIGWINGLTDFLLCRLHALSFFCLYLFSAVFLSVSRKWCGYQIAEQ